MKEIIATGKAPQAIGPYSQGVKVSCAKMIFCSGQIAIDPATKKIVGATAAEQCKQVMKNLSEILRSAGCGFSDVVKTTVYLADLQDFSAVNAVYATFFDKNPPARATVQAARLPLDAKVEIDAVAVL